MAHHLILTLALALIFISVLEAVVTVERGSRAILECSGFVASSGDAHASFIWYLGTFPSPNVHPSSWVAVYVKPTGTASLYHHLAERATIDRTSGALEIPKTRVSDSAEYRCYFANTTKGDIHNVTYLRITATPSPRDIKIFGSGPVEEGKLITNICIAQEVSPFTSQSYFQFTDSGFPLATNVTVIDNWGRLSWKTLVEFTFIANRNHQGKKLQCVVVLSGKSITSAEEIEIQVLYKLIGTPSIQAEKESGRVNSAISFTCDTEGVDGIITYYLWQFSDGTIIKNTTQSTTEYKTAFAGKFNVLCIAGNSFGVTGKSDSLEVEVLKTENPTFAILGSLLGISLCANLTLAICLICYCRRNTKKTSSNQSTTHDPHHYYEIDLQQLSAGHPVAPTDTATRPNSYVNSPAQENSVSQGITTSGKGHYTSLQK